MFFVRLCSSASPYCCNMLACDLLLYNSNSMFLSFLFLAISIGSLVKLNGFYTSIKTGRMNI